ncbi:MAG: hypothetical protein IPL79_12225 [Myxococcales bacterium]|nr:hypothetical protein [Myxococcales bacterium]
MDPIVGLVILLIVIVLVGRFISKKNTPARFLAIWITGCAFLVAATSFLIDVTKAPEGSDGDWGDLAIMFLGGCAFCLWFVGVPIVSYILSRSRKRRDANDAMRAESDGHQP